MKSVLEVLKATTVYFQKHEIESPRLNIEHLLAHVLQRRRMDLYLEFDRPLSDKELEPLRDLVKRRASGEPLQHLLGSVDFLGRKFLCDKRALIPRPETEQLAEMLLQECQSAQRIVDVGTGSGVLARSLAAGLPGAQVEAVDFSAEALSLARENAAQLGLADRVLFHQGDLLDPVSGVFDLVVANLPYIPRSEIPGLSREVQHDPTAALDGGPVGTELILRLLEQCPEKLAGLLALEIGLDQGPELQARLEALGFRNIRLLPDYQGHSRFLLASYG
jgi:release factor glutamine methyltransferase